MKVSLRLRKTTRGTLDIIIMMIDYPFRRVRTDYTHVIFDGGHFSHFRGVEARAGGKVR